MFSATHTEPAVIADIRYGVLLDAARKMGAEHGIAAASWYFDGNTSDDTYRAVLKGIDDGDPEILATFPVVSPSEESILDELGADTADEWNGDLLSAYEDGFYDASSRDIERVARLQTRCYCPDDCSCHYPHRLTLCGCTRH